MGCCASSPETKDTTGNKYKLNNSKHGSARNGGLSGNSAQPPKPSLDDGLQDLYEPVHLLGAGGTGETWLVKDRANGNYLAVKLIKRAIPAVLQPMMVREIEVCAFLDFDKCCCSERKQL